MHSSGVVSRSGPRGLTHQPLGFQGIGGAERGVILGGFKGSFGF